MIKMTRAAGLTSLYNTLLLHRGSAFDSRAVQTFVCMNISVCIGCGVVFFMYCTLSTKKVFKNVLYIVFPYVKPLLSFGLGGTVKMTKSM
jgi:hypothetical protein